MKSTRRRLSIWPISGANCRSASRSCSSSSSLPISSIRCSISANLRRSISASPARKRRTYALATRLATDLNGVPGVVDSHVFQVPDRQRLTVDVDRDLAREVGARPAGHRQRRAGAPNNACRWPRTSGSIREQRELPAGRADADLPINKAQDLWTLPVTAPARRKHPQL